ncbi:MAG: YCF48-related protein [Pseudonocardiaceae bacterium]
MSRFDQVIQILDEAVGGPEVNIGFHRAFWRRLTRDEFVAKQVFGLDLVVADDGAASNLVKALKGESPFGADLPDPPPDAGFSRMPAGRPPVSPENIAFIEQWIDDGCPEQDDTRTFTWRRTGDKAGSRHDDVWFATPDLGWAVNSDGKILRTADGGDHWEQQFLTIGLYLRCVGFASESRGWVGTLSPARPLLETSNGGATWNDVENLPELAPSAVCGLSVVDESVVYASGTNHPFPTVNRPPRMMKTVDGGATWTAWDMTSHASLLVDTYFTTPDRGWVVGGKADPSVDPGENQRENVRTVVLFTDDGGQTWVNRVADLEDELPLGEWGWKIHFIDDRIGFVSLEADRWGAILKTTDGGQTWTRLEINDPQKNANLEGIGFIDEDQGWVGGWGDATFEAGFSSATADGGHTWRDANEIGLFINRFRFLGDPLTVGYAAGLFVYKYSDEPVPATAMREVTPAPLLLDDTTPIQSERPVRINITVPDGSARLVIGIWERFGTQVRQLLEESQPEAGSRTIDWDVHDDGGKQLNRGSFIVRVTVDDQSESRIVRVMS